jgi:Cof subfamily protein (haloacid dehalogenase superfamily)
VADKLAATELGADLAIRLVVTDVDGTLVRTDKTLAPSTVAAAHRLRAGGVRLCLVSSRPARGLDMLLAPLGIDTPRAGFNGAEILAPGDTRLSELTLPEEVAAEAVAHMAAAGLDVWVFAGGHWYLTHPEGHYVPREHLAVRMEFVRVPDFSGVLGGVHKIMGSHTDFALMAREEAALAASLGEQATVLRSQSYYLDVTHRRATKGYAALRLAELLGVAPGEMACIGDMPNDTPMFAVAGVAIAMGNAPDAVKALAHQSVEHTNDQDGWAEAIDRFVLPRG